MMINDTWEILPFEKGIGLFYKNGDQALIDATGIHATTNDGCTCDVTFKDGTATIKTHCPLCDDHHGCDNCYYGQKELDPHCKDCEHNGNEIPTEWQPLGDNYCRKCGRKLRA